MGEPLHARRAARLSVVDKIHGMVRKVTVLWPVVVSVLLSASACAEQTIIGDWQGTLGEGRKFRVVLKILGTENGNLSANLFSIDQSAAAIPVQSLAWSSLTVTFNVPSIRGSYKGTLSGDGITGVWTQANGSHVLNFVRATRESAWGLDQSPHKASFVTVEPGVKLEVLDWGGSGRPVVLLAGLGDTAHVFDQFASKLSAKYHVYGVTRRGFGASDSPPTTGANYSARRLGDDVIAVLDALKLDNPLLVGHSIAGEELSSIGSRQPQRVSGLVYLDGGYSYAIYNGSPPDLQMDLLRLRENVSAILNAISPQQQKLLLADLTKELTKLEKAISLKQRELADIPDISPEEIRNETKRRESREGLSARAVQDGREAFKNIGGPVLAIFAVPHRRGGKADPDAEAKDVARVEPLIKAFEAGIPQGRIVRIPHASHYVFSSNEAEVIREIDAFISTLKQ